MLHSQHGSRTSIFNNSTPPSPLGVPADCTHSLVSRLITVKSTLHITMSGTATMTLQYQSFVLLVNFIQVFISSVLDWKN